MDGWWCRGAHLTIGDNRAEENEEDHVGTRRLDELELEMVPGDEGEREAHQHTHEVYEQGGLLEHVRYVRHTRPVICV